VRDKQSEPVTLSRAVLERARNLPRTIETMMDAFSDS
jgi:hypothetical protein